MFDDDSLVNSVHEGDAPEQKVTPPPQITTVTSLSAKFPYLKKGCPDLDSDSDDEQDVIIVQKSPTPVTTPVHETQEQDEKGAAQRLGLAFPTHVVTREASSIPAEKSSLVSPASTPIASAGNTPPVYPRTSAGRLSKSTGKQLASSSKTPIPADRFVSAGKLIPADRSVYARKPISTDRSVSAGKPIPADRSVSADKSISADSVAHALLDPDWVEAIQEELQQFQNQRVWVLVELPEGKHAIGTKWILKNKRDARGIVYRNKARVKAIRLFLAFASYMGFMVYQMDVKSAFLNGEIQEEVYVTQPKGFEEPKRGTIDQTLFLKKDSKDIILSQFEMSSMGQLTFFLGLQVDQRSDGIFIHQTKYVNDILHKFDMDTNKSAPTPFEPPKIKDKNLPDGPINVYLYRSMIGSLMYLTASRPDITFTVSTCARNQVSPTVSNLNAVKRIFKNIKGHHKLGLWYPRDSPFDLEAFLDSDYAGTADDWKSTTGGCQFIGRRPLWLHLLLKLNMWKLLHAVVSTERNFLAL
nr:retrovirus-related Pol polyprotein from transposon TNT 1-94 [Tanacetum cinerariifolium]